MPRTPRRASALRWERASSSPPTLGRAPDHEQSALTLSVPSDVAGHRGPRSIVAAMSPRTYRRITLVALVALAFIVVTGAAVRLTGSGLGCPRWPNCDTGHLSPHGTTGYHGAVEFVNRVFTGLVSVLVIVAVLGSLVRTPRRRDLTWLSAGLVVGV